MTAANPDVLIVGAGVSGLSSALALLDAGRSVTVYASDRPQGTTSAVAGALWGPHLVGNDSRVGRWAEVSLNRFRELADEPAAGIQVIAGMTATVQPGPAEPPEFARGAGPLTRCVPADLPAGYRAGWRYSAPVIAMAAYLDYLVDLLLSKGGQLHLGQPVRSLATAAERFGAPILVNCTGMGARDLIGDPGLIPVRGQVVVVANPGLTEFFVGDCERPDELTYFFPHGATAILGGTQQAGDVRTRPDPLIAERILASCAAVDLRLASAPVLAHRVGLRPVRQAVRLELENIDGARHVVHNYGHGGAGVTLSWGCATEVADIVSGLPG